MLETFIKSLKEHRKKVEKANAKVDEKRAVLVEAMKESASVKKKGS